MIKQDIFIEKIVKKRKTSKDFALIGLLIFAIPFLFFILLQVGAMLGEEASIFIVRISLPLFVGIIYLVYRLISGMNAEFEYIATNEDLTIDKIIARRKRKRLYNGSCKNFTILAPVSDRSFQTNKTNRVKILDYSSGVENPNRWFLITKKDKEQIMIIFEPDDRLIQIFRRYNPRALLQAGITANS